MKNEITNNQKRIFSGIQPTGNLHLGNYLGAIKNWVNLQRDIPSIFSIVDLHAITVPQDPMKLRDSIHEVTAAIIASGVDVKKSILFNQSSVKEHTELAWIFNCVCRIGWLNRMTQFKEKAGKNREKATVGLYSYPVLMAADILLYKATHVPVGEDQKQHIELARDIASAFNSMFTKENEEDFFSLPEPQILGTATRVMSLRDGTKKMSKSDESSYSRIDLKDSADEIVKKIKKAKSDSLPIPESLSELDSKPEALNLLNIYSDLNKSTLEKTLNEMKGKDYSYLKNKLSEILIEIICPIGKKITQFLDDKNFLEKVINEGSEKANKIAQKNLKEIKNTVGFL